MTSEKPSTFERLLTWLVVILTAALLVWGVSQYGLSTEVRDRFWTDIVGRTDGPMTFRFFLQPVMAFLAALQDGIRDARLGHKSFFWTAIWDPSQPAGRLREGLVATARIMLLGIGMDVIYQHMVFQTFYPVEALLMALLLAVIPYFIFRWIVEFVARRWLAREGSASP